MNPKGVFMTKEQYDIWDQTPKISKDKSSTTAKVVYNEELFKDLVADYETSNVSKAYFKLKNVDKYYKEQGLKLIEPITKSWFSTSLQRIDIKHPNGKTDTAALNMITDALSFIGKHKTTQDPEFAARDQQTANNLLSQLRGKDRTEQLQLLKTYSEKINGIVGRMGYYGNATIYDKYKKGVIGQNLDYYPQGKGKNRDDYYNETQENGIIDRTIFNYKQFREVDKDIRKQTKEFTNSKWKEISDRFGYDLSKPQFDLAMNTLVDENGNIASYAAWKKNMFSQKDTGDYY
jgi:hypothetical protein